MPFIKAHQGQEPELAGLLAREPFFNLFLIANLSEGLSDHLEVWTDAAGGMLMRRHGNWMLATGPARDAFDAVAAAAIIDTFGPEQVTGLVGRPDGVEGVVAQLQRHQGRLYQQMFAAMNTPLVEMVYAGTPRPATPADLERLVSIYADAGDMSRPREAVVRMLPTCWVTEADGAVVSAAYVSGRTPQAAMVGGVFTPEPYRGLGYATGLVHAMSTALIAEDQRPCLFYHNPDAGRIYLRMGFRELGPWRMVKF